MKILITGAKGMLAQDLSPVLEDEGFDVIETDFETLDITNFAQAKKVINEAKPDFVIHCAAYTNVDGAEDNQDTAYKINAEGAENIAKICAENDITMVYFSTDYVFDGQKTTPYIPTDLPNPLSLYGKTKLQGEFFVQKYCKKFYIIRTSWLYGHYGANFVEKMLSLAEKPELKVVNDQIGCPTWSVDLANAVADLIDAESDYGVYHISGGGQTSWFGFAQEIFKSAGLKVNLLPCTSEEFNSKAKRPKYSVLDNEKRCRSWKSALKDYIALR